MSVDLKLADRLRLHYGLDKQGHLSDLFYKIASAADIADAQTAFLLALREIQLRTYYDCASLIERTINPRNSRLDDPDAPTLAAKDSHSKLLVVLIRDAARKVPR